MAKPKGGGEFKSEEQRRFMWATVPRAAHKWAHRMKTAKTDWAGKRKAKARKGKK